MWVFYEWNLALFMVVKLIVTILSLSMPVPGGVYIPVFSAGAAFGLIYQSLIYRAFYAMGKANWIR